LTIAEEVLTMGGPANYREMKRQADELERLR